MQLGREHSANTNQLKIVGAALFAYGDVVTVFILFILRDHMEFSQNQIHVVVSPRQAQEPEPPAHANPDAFNNKVVFCGRVGEEGQGNVKERDSEDSVTPDRLRETGQ